MYYAIIFAAKNKHLPCVYHLLDYLVVFEDEHDLSFLKREIPFDVDFLIASSSYDGYRMSILLERDDRASEDKNLSQEIKDMALILVSSSSNTAFITALLQGGRM